jgi:hypothetical protein
MVEVRADCHFLEFVIYNENFRFILQQQVLEHISDSMMTMIMEELGLRINLIFRVMIEIETTVHIH